MKVCSTLTPMRILRSVSRFVLLTVLLLAGAAPAWAQLSRIGSVTATVGKDQIGAPAIKGTDNAWDPVNDVYLIVGAYGPHFGIFVNRFGIPVTGHFFIKQGGGGSHFPRARYSPHVNGGQGGFLVTWSEEGPSGQNTLHSRIVAYPGVLVGVENIISDGATPPWLESGPAIGYSPASQRFYVAWSTYPPGRRVMGRLVGLDGAGIGGIQQLSSGFGRDPGVAWNSISNQFGVSFNAETASGTTGFSAFAIVSAVDGSFSRQSFNAINGFTYISDVAYNQFTNRYVMTWWQHLSGGGDETRVAEIDAVGNLVTTGLVTSLFAGYDSLSIAFNIHSGTFALVGLPATDQVLATELNIRGFRTSALTDVSGPGLISRYMRVTANTELPEWNTTFNHFYTTALNLIIGTTSTGGGPAGEYGPPGGSPPPQPGPAPPPPPPGGCTTPQPASDWVCVNGNWLPPSSGGSGTSACPTPQPGPGWICSNGNWLPPSSGGSGTSGCTTPQPASDWVCVNGNWLPGSGGGGSGTSGCPTVQPGPDWVCVNGNWLPGSSGGGGTSACPTVQPGPDWVCVNGNWLPGTGGTGGSSCTTPQPGSTWVCVNGNWLPGSGGTGGSSCTTPQPGTDWVCVNGNWLPGSGGSGGSTCTTPQPGSTWTCVNGNWLPPGSGGGSTCTTPQPGPTWTCSNGNWLPPSISCTTPQPGPTWVCVNGNWLPGEPLMEAATFMAMPDHPSAPFRPDVESRDATADRPFAAIARQPARLM